MGLRVRFVQDAYHYALRASSIRFLGGVCLLFVVTNFIFGTLYYYAGPGAISNLDQVSDSKRFFDCVFFSVQTLATIGYGAMAPVSTVAHVLVSVQAFLGPLAFAVATGLLFARFSKPTARVSFSHKAVITQRDGVPTLMFRVANERTTQILDARVNVIALLNSVTKEGVRFRRIVDLELIRSRSPIFAASWTVMHPINDKSPLNRLKKEHLKELEAEVLVTLTGLDDTFNQQVHSRHSYVVDEIFWDYQFVDMITRNERGEVTIDLTKLNEIYPV